MKAAGARGFNVPSKQSTWLKRCVPLWVLYEMNVSLSDPVRCEEARDCALGATGEADCRGSLQSGNWIGDRQAFGPWGEVQPLCAASDISATLFSDKCVVRMLARGLDPFCPVFLILALSACYVEVIYQISGEFIGRGVGNDVLSPWNKFGGDTQ